MRAKGKELRDKHCDDQNEKGHEKIITVRVDDVDGNFGIERLLHRSIETVLEDVEETSFRDDREQDGLNEIRKRIIHYLIFSTIFEVNILSLIGKLSLIAYISDERCHYSHNWPLTDLLETITNWEFISKGVEIGGGNQRVGKKLLHIWL